jgi:C-terminal processing protease CtpA/Prc
VDWDAALTDYFGVVRDAADDDAVREALLAMISRAGPLPPPVGPPDVFTSDERVLYDMDWVEDPFYTGELGTIMRALRVDMRARPHVLVTPESGTFKPDFDSDIAYNDPFKPYPERKFRVLAFCRFWNAILYYYPYRDVMDRDWHTVLREHILDWIRAENKTEYHLAARRTAVELCDSHAFVQSSLLSGYFGAATASFSATDIDGESVVLHSYDANIRPGDIIREIDGVPIAQRRAELEPYVDKTSPSTRAYSLNTYILRGPGGQSSVTLEDAQGVRTEMFERGAKFGIWTYSPYPVTFDTVISNGAHVGYVDLNRLEPEQVDGMMQAFRDMDAIVFDMRGYPNGTAWPLAQYLLPADTKIARFDAARCDYPGMVQWMTYSDGGGNAWQYEGKIVVLISEAALSQAEYTCMFLDAAPRCVFIGSPTRGSDGNVTSVHIPGAMSMMFTGLGVFYPDGRPTQRVGIQPDILVRPTLAGLRAGRDELLDAALHPSVVSAQSPPPVAPNTLKVYPNPSHGEIHCLVSSPIRHELRIHVTDVLGRLVYSATTTSGSSVTIPAAALPHGVYLLSLHDFGSEHALLETTRLLRY